MRNAITWKQVAAPDFSDALRANRQMGDFASSAFEGLSDIAGDYRQGQKDRASNQAVTQALGIDDPEAFAEAMQSGSLGINPADMNAETMDFLSQYGSQLTTDQNTAARTEYRQASTANTLQDMAWNAQRRPVEAALADQNTAARTANTEASTANTEASTANTLQDMAWNAERRPIKADLADQNTEANIANTEASTANTEASTTNTLQDMSQSQTRFGQKQDAYNRNLPRVLDQERRADQALLDKDANEAMLLKAQTEVNDLSNNTTSRADAERAIIGQNFPAAQEKARLDALAQVPDAQWAVSDSITREVAGLEPVVAIDQGIDNFTSGMNAAVGSDDVLRAHMQFKQEFSGITNPVKSVIDGYFEGAKDDEGSSEIKNSRSNIISETEKLVSKHDLPREVIAGVVKEKMKGTWFDGRGEIDWDAADALLSDLADPSKQNMLNSVGNTLEDRQRELSDFTAKSQATQDDLKIAIRDHGSDSEEAKALKAELETLFSDFAKWERDQTPMDELTKTDEQRAAEAKAAAAAEKVRKANEAALAAAAEADDAARATREAEVSQADSRRGNQSAQPMAPTIPRQRANTPTATELLDQAGRPMRERLPGFRGQSGTQLEDILDEKSMEFLFGSGR